MVVLFLGGPLNGERTDWTDPPNYYAYIEREGCGIRILEAGEGNPLIAGNRRFRYYVDVRDVDGLYAELKPRLDTLPKEDVHGPADKPYGQRELLVKVPDGDLIAFGQGIFTPEGAQVTPGGQDEPHVSKM